MNKTQTSSHWQLGEYQAWLSVVKAYALCERALARQLAPLGLNVPKNDLLANIALAPGSTQQELSSRLLATRSNVSMLLTTLEKQGLVVRRSDPSDGRAHRVFLTSAGSKLAEKAKIAQFEVVELMLGSVTKREIAATQSAMKKIQAVLGNFLER